MYFIFVTIDQEAVDRLEKVLYRVDQQKRLLAVANGYDLIQFLQNVKKGESYPDLIVFATQQSRLTGKELLELLRSDDIYCLIPVLVFLPGLVCEEADYCRQLGADTLQMPSIEQEWIHAARQMCATCS
jgi:CheY-like chemotaxis protein